MFKKQKNKRIRTEDKRSFKEKWRKNNGKRK